VEDKALNWRYIQKFASFYTPCRIFAVLWHEEYDSANPAYSNDAEFSDLDSMVFGGRRYVHLKVLAIRPLVMVPKISRFNFYVEVDSYGGCGPKRLAGILNTANDNSNMSAHVRSVTVDNVFHDNAYTGTLSLYRCDERHWIPGACTRCGGHDTADRPCGRDGEGGSIGGGRRAVAHGNCGRRSASQQETIRRMMATTITSISVGLGTVTD
jgi:hypothetical protein